MAHLYSAIVTSKGVGDYETEDAMMQEIRDFMVALRQKYLEKASVLVKTEWGVDPNALAKSMSAPVAENKDVIDIN